MLKDEGKKVMGRDVQLEELTEAGLNVETPFEQGTQADLFVSTAYVPIGHAVHTELAVSNVPGASIPVR